MKLRSTFTAMSTSLLALCSAAACAQAAPAEPAAAAATPRVDQRQANQSQRIEQGKASGELTAREHAGSTASKWPSSAPKTRPRPTARSRPGAQTPAPLAGPRQPAHPPAEARPQSRPCRSTGSRQVSASQRPAVQSRCGPALCASARWYSALRGAPLIRPPAPRPASAAVRAAALAACARASGSASRPRPRRGQRMQHQHEFAARGWRRPPASPAGRAGSVCMVSNCLVSSRHSVTRALGAAAASAAASARCGAAPRTAPGAAAFGQHGWPAPRAARRPWPAGSRRRRSPGRRASPATLSAASALLGPGSGSTRWPAARTAATSTAPGSLTRPACRRR
jgi:hypothetical protein